ncbi:MAG: hypothetical protein PHY34_04970 [Patescibacteria group bacterium]|nr:hypothetical protein [Patescibacteria group bacterium]MDD5715538.1 hypothetical protein [Patescibacteria group bacterium]
MKSRMKVDGPFMGKVTHCYSQIGCCAVRIQAGLLAVGSRIVFAKEGMRHQECDGFEYFCEAGSIRVRRGNVEHKVMQARAILNPDGQGKALELIFEDSDTPVITTDREVAVMVRRMPPNNADVFLRTS